MTDFYRYLYHNFNQQNQDAALEMRKKSLENQRIREGNNYNVRNQTLKSTVDVINNKYHEMNPRMSMDEIKSMDIEDKLEHMPDYIKNRYKKQKRNQTTRFATKMVASPLISAGIYKGIKSVYNLAKNIKGI